MDPLPITAQQAAQILASVHTTPAMVRYDYAMAAIGIAGEILGLAWLWVVLATGLSRLIARWSGRLGNVLFAQGALYWVGFRVIRWVVFMPLAVYAGYHLPHVYSLSQQPFAPWLGDRIKGLLVDTVIGAVIAGTLLSMIRRWPVRWPMIFAIFTCLLIGFLVFVTPLIIDPIFNKFTPLAASSPLRPGIERLAARAGILNADIFVVDKSKQTNETNAYVTGLGSSSRIVIWDTLIQRVPADQLDAIVAHEIGHYVEHHVVIGYAAACIAIFLLFPLLRSVSESILRKWGERWGLRSLHDPAAIPVLLLVIGVAETIALPLTTAASRIIEHRADAFGLALCQDRPAMARAFISLSRDNLALPYPPAWMRLLEDHPPLGERIDYALHGRPSELWPVPPQLPPR